MYVPILCCEGINRETKFEQYDEKVLPSKRDRNKFYNFLKLF